jgi:hypothetical protein
MAALRLLEPEPLTSCTWCFTSLFRGLVPAAAGGRDNKLISSQSTCGEGYGDTSYAFEISAQISQKGHLLEKYDYSILER